MTVVGRMRLLRSLFFQTATPASCTADVSPVHSCRCEETPFTPELSSCTADVSPNEWSMISSIDWPYPSSSVPMRPSATFSLPVHSQRDTRLVGRDALHRAVTLSLCRYTTGPRLIFGQPRLHLG